MFTKISSNKLNPQNSKHMICFVFEKAALVGITANIIALGVIGYVLTLVIITLNLSIKVLRKKLKE